VTDNEYLAAVKKINTLAQRTVELRLEIGGLVDKVLEDGWSLRQLSKDTGVTVNTLKRYRQIWKSWGDERIPGCTSLETYEWASQSPRRKRLLMQGVSKNEVLAKEIAAAPKRPRDFFAELTCYLSWVMGFSESELLQMKEISHEGESYQKASEMARRCVKVFTELGLVEVPPAVHVDVPVPTDATVDVPIPTGRLFRRSRRAA
jgi:hypothetical protein